MKILTNLFVTLAAILLITSCGNQNIKADKLDVIEVSVDSLLRDASALEGKTVRFQAKVDHACMHGGKRLTVYGSIEGKTMKIDGTEKSPKFVSSLMDKTVEVTGIVKKVAGSHVADCEAEEGNEIPEVAYVIECIDYSEI
ncbi:MAG: hypothetical protein CVT98_07870 [Bacteroidetes bacterium HGW-Bacteroidetes-15]|nr:MAG: hypothetical protein CVT98_07870 [Bacteroidetes bacterium HGW-Bacteroidetes-15]